MKLQTISLFLCLWATARATQTTCPCGHVNKGGSEYTFMLKVVTLKDKKTVCGATILTQEHAITAAHCTRMAGAEPLAVVSDNGDAQVVKVSKFEEHVGYNEKNGMNDIAILFLETPLTFNQRVAPVCLPNMLLNNVDRNVKIIGWNEEAGRAVLKDVDAKVSAPGPCREVFHQFVPNPLFPTQICTFQTEKERCLNNSGSPVVYLDPAINSYTLVGVVSYGGSSECDTKIPTVETDISVYMRWIQFIIKSPLCHKV